MSPDFPALSYDLVTQYYLAISGRLYGGHHA